MAQLLFDEPLSEQLCDSLEDLFPGSLHVRLLGQGGAADPTVWELAREHGCMIVSKDGDFHRLVVLRGAPPKFIWMAGKLRCGVLDLCSSEVFARVLEGLTLLLKEPRHRHALQVKGRSIS